MNEILTPVLIVAGIGLLAGLILAIASIVMAVPKDEKAEALRGLLPGANCGACGFSGCDGYAKAMSSGEAKPGLCTVGGEAVAKTTSEYLGLDSADVTKKIALVHCLGSYDNTSDKVEYQGIETCAGAAIVAGGIASCQYGCMGIGDCMLAGMAIAVPKPAIPSRNPPKHHPTSRMRRRLSAETPVSICLIMSIAPVFKERL